MKTVTARIPEELFREIEVVCDVEKSDRAEVLRRLLDSALKEWKLKRALELLREGRVTLRKAAKMAGRRYVEMLDIASKNNIPLQMEPEDVFEDLR
jgi:predicted HTH domain antitoxin